MTNRTDTFNRADGAVGTPSDGGSAWVLEGGTTWVVASNQGRKTATEGVDGVMWLESSESDGTVQVTFPAVGITWIGITFRGTDASNYFMAAMGQGAGELRLYDKTAGVDTQLGSSYTYNPQDGDTLAVVFSGTSIDVKLNGVSRITTTNSTRQTATKHGVRIRSNDARVDDFSFTGAGGGGSTWIGKRKLLLGVG